MFFSFSLVLLWFQVLIPDIISFVFVIAGNQIITPIHYYIDNNNNKIFDIEEIERLFYEELNQLKALNNSYKMEAL